MELPVKHHLLPWAALPLVPEVLLAQFPWLERDDLLLLHPLQAGPGVSLDAVQEGRVVVRKVASILILHWPPRQRPWKKRFLHEYWTDNWECL